jgi:hypothetical protein
MSPHRNGGKSRLFLACGSLAVATLEAFDDTQGEGMALI